MSNDNNSYNSILKATALFGGVKVFQILVGLIRNKIVAVLLGPIGMGISGLLSSTVSTINAASGFGLHTSSVRDIARAKKTGDEYRIGLVITVLRILVVLTGLLGTAICFFLAPILSEWSFGNSDYTTAYRILSVVLFVDQMIIGQTALMQGTFHYKYMGMSQLWGSVIGLIVSVPCYYLWGYRAIVPVIILVSVSNLILTTFFSNKIKYQKVKLNLKQVLSVGKGMLVLGFAIALSGFVNTSQVYILRAFISQIGSVADVGLYTAGISIATMYINVILQSMGSDYSPRLASVSDDNKQFIETINRQIVLMVTIITPLIIPFVVFIKPITVLLYSNKFLPISTMIEWIMFAMIFRTISWSMSYSMVAKGKSSGFFFVELATGLFSLILSAFGYWLYSFEGMGVAFLLTYVFYCFIQYFVCKRTFQFGFNKQSVLSMIWSILILSPCFLILQIIGYSVWRYIIGLFMIVAICGLYLYKFNNLVPLRIVINKIVKR